MNVNDDSDILCDAVSDSYADGFFLWVYCIKCTTSLIAIVPALLTLTAVIRATALHRNIRMLLLNFFIATIIANLGSLVMGGYNVWAIISSQSEADLCVKVAITGRMCTWLQCLNMVGAFTIATSLIFLAVERICATVQFKTYENNGGRKLGVTLTVLQWIMSIPSLPFFGTEQRYPYCQPTVVQPHLSQVYLTFMLLAQVTGLIVFVILVYVNKRKMERYTFNSALKLLSVRYQLKENVTTTKLMIPVSVASCFLFAIPLVAIFFLLNNVPDNAPLTKSTVDLIIIYARYSEIAHFVFPIYTTTLCAVVICCNNHIRQAAKKLIGCIVPNFTVAPLQQTTVENDSVLESEQTRKLYFDALKKQWDDAEPQSRSTRAAHSRVSGAEFTQISEDSQWATSRHVTPIPNTQ